MVGKQSIQNFLVLAKTLNFSRTAELLGVSQQSVSQSISRLESAFGFSLFTRTNHSVVLTPQGKACYTFYSDFAEREKKLIQSCLVMSQTRPNHVRLGVQDWIFLPQALGYAGAEFETRFPDWCVEISRTQPGLLLDGFRRKQLDLIIIYQRWLPTLAAAEQVFLKKVELAIVAPTVGVRFPLPKTLAEFSGLPFLTNNYGNEKPSETKKRALSELAALGIVPGSIDIKPKLEAAYTAVELGEGCVLSSMASRVISGPTTTIFPTGKYDSLICLSHTDVNEAIRTYVNLLAAAYAETDAIPLCALGMS